MVKKILGFILKVLWIIFILSVPTIILSISYVIHTSVSEMVYAIFLYFTPIIFIALIIFVILFIWKKSYSLFVSSIGFFISPIFVSSALSFLGIRNIIDSSFGGKSMAIIVLGMFYALPFAATTLIAAILIKNKNINR